MRITIDEREEKMKVPLESSLGDILDRIWSERIPDNRVITHIRVNGEELLEDENGIYPDLPGDEIDSLELQTGVSQEMVFRALSDAKDYLGRLNPGIEETAELFRVGDETKAHTQYGQCLDGINWFIQIVEGARQVVGLDYNKIVFNRVSVQSYVENLEHNIRELWRAQQEEDWIMLSDLLEYELLPMMEGWKEILPLIEEAAENRVTGTERVEMPRQ
jgi:hypothetical protein